MEKNGRTLTLGCERGLEGESVSWKLHGRSPGGEPGRVTPGKENNVCGDSEMRKCTDNSRKYRKLVVWSIGPGAGWGKKGG